MPAPPPRLTRRPFPPYAYVPRMHPHPLSSASGHSAGQTAEALDPTDLSALRQCHYWAIDLFNYGYYWEAHEVWETLWQAMGRTGPPALYFKGLIKLAAAGVKARQNSVIGVQRHARRAAELFQQCAADTALASDQELGPGCDWLHRESMATWLQAETLVDPSVAAVKRVLPFVLLPGTR